MGEENERYQRSLLGFVACHLQRKNTIEEVTNIGDVTLVCLHIDVYRPQIPSFGVRVDDPFKDGLSALCVTEFVFKLSEF